MAIHNQTAIFSKSKQLLRRKCFYIYIGVGMFDFVQQFIYFVIDVQSKLLGKKRNNRTRCVHSNKKINSCATLELNSKNQTTKTKLENDVKIILKKYSNDPEKLLNFVQKNGTKVYKIPFAKKLLAIVGFEDGFIGETSGFKAFYLNCIISAFSKEKKAISFNTKPMFILNNSTPDKYYTIQQFHKWYAMKLNLPGFDAQSQTNFQKFLNAPDSNIKELGIDEILGLKDAIARDVEAINFIVDMAKSNEGSQNAMKKVTTGGASV